MRVWTWLRNEWAKERWKILEVIGVFAAAVGAILIPYALDQAADQRRDTEVETRTLQVMNDVNREIGKILQEQPALQVKDQANLTYEILKRDVKLNGAAIRLLNEYAYVCLGGNKKLLTPGIMKDLRGEAIKQTWTLYKDYIVEFRKVEREGKPPTTDRSVLPWIQCDIWLEIHYPGWKW